MNCSVTCKGNKIFGSSGASIEGLLSAQDGASLDVVDSIFLANVADSNVRLT
jgi:hypothetical protein